MNKWWLGIFILLLLTGCQGHTQTIINWVDFIKSNGKSYEGIYSGVLADEKFIGEIHMGPALMFTIETQRPARCFLHTH
ncbi:hypothetical protein [Bacillus rubiinfantis]|uniref:hypothetical protein n=1 Tax=Bacillus rubiinfantis TaxID=1499680 RepID=UPI0005AB4FED|nr:hypothetical protein [Bacillus rubiinfantis]